MQFLQGTYNGEIKRKLPHGNGVYVADDGTTYRGVWKRGDLPFGAMHKGRTLYVGELKNLLPHGNGTEYVSRNRKFVGEWQCGKKVACQGGKPLDNVIEAGIKDGMWLSYVDEEQLLRGKLNCYNDYWKKIPLKRLNDLVGFATVAFNDDYKYPYGYSGCGVAQALVKGHSYKVTGNSIICRIDDQGNMRPFGSTQELEMVYDAIWEQLFDPNYSDLNYFAHAVKVVDVQTDSQAIYLVKDKLYLVDYSSWENSDFDPYEGWQSSHVCARVRMHLLPDAMVDPKQALQHVADKNEWSATARRSQECNEADTANRALRELVQKCITDIVDGKVQ